MIEPTTRPTLPPLTPTTRRTTRRRYRQVSLSAVLLGTLSVVVACQSSPSTKQKPAPSETSGTATPSVISTTSTAAEAAATIIDITIADGVVTPTNARVSGVVGQPVVLAVNSDQADSLHIHSVPEQTFDVAARSGQRFEFTVAIPGRVSVELHELHRTVVTIDVLP